MVVLRFKICWIDGMLFIYLCNFHDLSMMFLRFLAFAVPLCAVSLNHWHSADLIPYHLLVQKFMWRGACVPSISSLPSLLSLSLSGLSGLHRMLGSNLPARGCVSCVGAVAQSICLHQWAGAAVGLGQQDPAKHQLLAAFYTDSHQVGHIYSTASCLVRLEDLSALSAWILFFSLVVSFCLFTSLDSQHCPQPVLFGPIYQSPHHSFCRCASTSFIFCSIKVKISAWRVCTCQAVVGPWH